MMHRRLTVASRFAFVLALTAVTYLSVTPVAIPSVTPDKLNHVIAYFGLGLLADFSVPNRGYALKAVPLFVYSWVIELIQRGVPGRQYESLDLVANAGGLLLYALLTISRARAAT